MHVLLFILYADILRKDHMARSPVMRSIISCLEVLIDISIKTPENSAISY